MECVVFDTIDYYKCSVCAVCVRVLVIAVVPHGLLRSSILGALVFG